MSENATEGTVCEDAQRECSVPASNAQRGGSCATMAELDGSASATVAGAAAAVQQCDAGAAEQTLPHGDAGDPFGKARYKAMKAQLKGRVGPKRFRHSVGVAKTAKKLAEVYGEDPKRARMAGLVHDWDKCYRDAESTKRALDLGLQIDEAILYQMPWLLHGPTAALALSREFPEWGEEVFQAIARHTCGAADMTPLDCIIYTADIIEPGRDYGPDSGLEQLRALVGEVPLQELYYQAFKFTLRYLLDGDKRLFPGTAEIYNELIVRHAQWSGVPLRQITV